MRHNTQVVTVAALAALSLLPSSSDAFAPTSTTIRAGGSRVAAVGSNGRYRIAVGMAKKTKTVSESNGTEGEVVSAEGAGGAAAEAAADDGSAVSSFDDANRAARDQQDAEALAKSSNMSDEELAAFNARSSEFSSMKDRIRARAAELNIEKSVATAEAIKQAELRAKNMAASGYNDPNLDMSVFEKRMLTNPEDELTDEEMAEIDPVGQLSFFEQAIDEVKNTKFPSFVDVMKTVFLMAIVFAVSAFIILQADEFLRNLYMDWGFIPEPGEVEDYSKTMELPKDWDKDLNDLSGLFDVATKVMGVKVPEAPTLNVDVPTDL